MGLVILSSAWVGCLGGADETPTSGVDQCEQANRTEIGSDAVTPDEPLSLEASFPNATPDATVWVSAEGAAILQVDLERDGELVWSRALDSSEEPSGEYHPQLRSPGNYTLTASTEAGAWQVAMGMMLTTDGEC